MVTETLTRTCRALRKDGQPCLAPPGRTGYCMVHDPALEDKRRAAYRLGGEHKAKAVRLRMLVPPRLMPVYNKLEAALEEVHSGTLEPRRATAMAALAGAMVRVLTSGELEERVRTLEDATGNRSKT